MSDSTQENLFQAMDRLVRLAKALPETTVTLVEWPKLTGFTVFVGESIPKNIAKSIERQGRIVLRSTWTELVAWVGATERVRGEGPKVATDS